VSTNQSWSTWSLSTKLFVSIGLAIAGVFIIGINVYR
jgi:hypothetical protein